MKSKQTLKVGQKYKVIEDSQHNFKNGTIVMVNRIIIDGMFRDANEELWDLTLDNLELITPKKKSKEIKKIDYLKIDFESSNEINIDRIGLKVNEIINFLKR